MAKRSCSDCRQFVYLDSPGQFGKRVERGGVPVRRLPAHTPPCRTCPKQPADVPEDGRCPQTAEELSETNWQAWFHYRQCKAVGQFPDDPIVRRNAAFFAAAEKVADQMDQLNVALLATRGGG